METIHTIQEMRQLRARFRAAGRAVGFIPTMGALHDGHLSLVTAARQECSHVVMSVYVNPTQFAPHEDFSRYPRPFELDRARAEEAGCDVLFAPTDAEMYPARFASYVNVGDVTERLEGVLRPDHYRGVATVVLKLINIVQPEKAYFGQKDAQQVVVIRKMVDELNVPVALEVVPTLRHCDGVVMSSRNVFLTAREREHAPVISQGLQRARDAFQAGARDATVLCDIVRECYERSGAFKVEYIAVADAQTFEEVAAVDRPTLLLVSCKTPESGTRLLDNVVLDGAR